MRIALLLATLVLTSACASLRGRREPPRATRVHPEPVRVGTITLVNEDDRFAVVDVGSAGVPPAGTALKVFGDGVETAVLAVGDVRRRPFIVGDIVSGMPRKGDAVFR